MPDILRSVFERAASVLNLAKNTEPLPYQLAVAEALLSGRRVVLRAPAASGKSLAAWLPWLVSRTEQHDFPQQMMHIVPGNAFIVGIENKLSTLASAIDRRLNVSIQTEADAFDPFFLADAIITSFDEVLSIALHQPLGLHPSMSNINGGVLLGAYLFCDEFPAFASPDSFLLWLGLLRQYYPTAPCLMSTALLPPVLMQRVVEALEAEYFDLSNLICGGRRSWNHLPSLSADGILRQHQERTIVVCNTVRGAQTLYRALQQSLALDGRPIELLLLHQYLLHRDRQRVEEQVTSLFSRDSSRNVLLVTTSGIKVGNDISAELLISDPASPDKLLLRAGRCARYQGETGRVVVAQVTQLPSSDVYPMPSGDLLIRELADGALHASCDELAACDAIWESATPNELPLVLRDLPSIAEIDAQPAQLINGDAVSPEAFLTRIGACLHRVPETVKDPFELERFSMAIPSLERGWRQWQASGSHGEWFALVPHWPPDYVQTPFWSLVSDPREFRAAARLVVLNSEAVSYDPVIGLELAPGTPYQSESLPAQHTSWPPFDQHLQRYEEHAARTLDAFQHLFPWYRFVLRHLGKRWRIPYIELDHWLRVCILWHDAGKLTADWQRSAHIWQSETIRRPYPSGVLARIDFESRRDRVFPCPPHARVSAQVLSKAISALVDGNHSLYLGTLAALAQHHGVKQIDSTDLTPHPEAWSTLLDLTSQLLEPHQFRRVEHIGWTMTPRDLATLSSTPKEPDAWMAYSLLVRAIRLSDREVSLSELFAG